MGYLLRLFTWILVIGVLYRLLNKYIIPVFRVTSATNDQLRKMQEQMKEMNKKMDKQPSRKKVKKDGDYIEYEEVD